MRKIVFKRFAEVQILHDYFLTMADGASFFSKNSEEKQQLLSKRIDRGLYAAHTIFELAPTLDTKKIMLENKMVFAKTALGFVLGIEVDEVLVSDEMRYKPVNDIPKSVALAFSLTPDLSYFQALTNLRFSSPYPSIYHFTNKGNIEFIETTIPPQASLPLAKEPLALQSDERYEMGTILKVNGTLSEAIQNTDGSDISHWEAVQNRRFATMADNILLPHNFQYKFRRDELVKKVEVRLEDIDGNEIKKIVKNFTEPTERILLNFSTINEKDPTDAKIPKGIYNLKLKINGGSELIHQIFLSNEYYNPDYFGIVELRFDEENSPFSLLDAEGFLKTKKDAEGKIVTHPIFELRLQNRKSFWRYTSHTDFTTDEIAATSAHLDIISAKQLIAKKPKGLTASLVPFRNGSELTLPVPTPPNIRFENNKMYSEIYISKTNQVILLNS